MIIQQKMIMLSLAVALLPLFIAVALVIYNRLKQRGKSLMQENVMQEEPIFVPQPAPVTVKTPATPVPEKTEEPVVSSAMQDLLSSVFTDEEANARYQVLLADSGGISASDVLALCRQIAAQLGV